MALAYHTFQHPSSLWEALLYWKVSLGFRGNRAVSKTVDYDSNFSQMF